MRYKLKTINNFEIEFKSLSAELADKYYFLLKKMNSLETEEYIFNEITDHRYDLETLPAGIILSVIFTAFKLSGVFKSEESIPEYIEKAREKENSNTYSYFYAVIIKFLPSYKLEDLKEKSINELLELIAIAETIAGTELFDTKKMKEAISSKENKAKTGISSVTKREIDALMTTLNDSQYDELM